MPLSSISPFNEGRNASSSLLTHSTLTVWITDLVAKYSLKHTFRNASEKAIEAIYTFPVPLDAAFIGMDARLAGQQRVAQVQLRQQATQAYDEAIADGDSAVLLEQLEPGLYCVNLGNLKPGEDGEINLQFSAPLQCADGRARFSLPLVHRPRYGRSRLHELTEPSHDFAIEHPLEANIYVRGLLIDSGVSCATHAVRFSHDGENMRLQLNRAMLDRDLVLSFDLPRDFNGMLRQIADDEGSAAMLSFTVPLALRRHDPCDLCLILDCSGSMQGDAIAQSRAALLAVAAELGDDDRVQVLRFGYTVERLFRRPMKASDRVRESMRELVGTINSDLGGTNMDDALNAALEDLESPGEAAGRRRAVVLVTDGAVQPHAIRAAQEQAQRLGIGVFVVAVGSSAGTDVLQPLAHATLAVLERAVPAEPIDEAVMRHLRRIRHGAPLTLSIDWNHPQVRALPLQPVFPGDAVCTYAFMPTELDQLVHVRLEDGTAPMSFPPLGREESPALRALAGLAAWKHADEDEQAAVALRYGLITPETSAVLVVQRAEGEKIDNLPQVVPVQHMLPHGMLQHAYLSTAAYSVGALSFARGSRPAFLRRETEFPETINVPEPTDTDRSEDDFDLMCIPDPVDPHDIGIEYEEFFELLEALTGAIIQLLCDPTNPIVSKAAVMALIDPRWHQLANAYLGKRFDRSFDRDAAIELVRANLRTDAFRDLSVEKAEFILDLLAGY